MRAYSNMPLDRFIDAIREAAINSKVPPVTIDLIDSLYDLTDKESELEAAGEETTKAEEARDDLHGELHDLLAAVRVVEDTDVYNSLTADEIKRIKNAIVDARNALERHK